MVRTRGGSPQRVAVRGVRHPPRPPLHRRRRQQQPREPRQPRPPHRSDRTHPPRSGAMRPGRVLLLMPMYAQSSRLPGQRRAARGAARQEGAAPDATHSPPSHRRRVRLRVGRPNLRGAAHCRPGSLSQPVEEKRSAMMALPCPPAEDCGATRHAVPQALALTTYRFGFARPVSARRPPAARVRRDRRQGYRQLARCPRVRRDQTIPAPRVVVPCWRGGSMAARVPGRHRRERRAPPRRWPCVMDRMV